jgi:hypothetical protein
MIFYFLLTCKIAIFLFCLCWVMFGSAHAQPSKQNWYLGEGLGVGDEFVYEVCDFVLRIPESPDHCYAYQKQTRNCRRDATSLHINNGLICFKDLLGSIIPWISSITLQVSITSQNHTSKGISISA